MRSGGGRAIDIRFPEKNKRAGVFYAVTDDGYELPVIDVTHPAFRIDPSPEDIDRRTRNFLKMMGRMEKLPRFLNKAMWNRMRHHSRLAAGLVRAEGAVLDSMTTYIMKLGPENLGQAYASHADREVADSLSPYCARLRLQYLAHVLAEGLALGLEARPGAPLHMVNIAGGPASDSLNALIVLQKEHPALLADRSVRIHVLDPYAAGPNFGCRALAALAAQGGPLAGMDPDWEHLSYDWGKTEPLDKLLGDLGSEGIVGVSSEGGLFEYGNDSDIDANLTVLKHHPAVVLMCGTVTKENEVTRLANASIRLSSVPRSREAFMALVEGVGWRADAVLETALTYVVRLRRVRPVRIHALT